MREGIDENWSNALAQAGIQTAMVGVFYFKSETVRVWTGWASMSPAGSGDGLLDGHVFEPFANGIPIEIGDNTFSYSGSDELSVSLQIPGNLTDEMVAASLDPDEYQGRTAVIWRALMMSPPTASTPPLWAFKRIRAGTMDQLVITDTGKQFIFNLSIEAHQAMITNATASTYLDQPKFDADDESQRFAVAIANNARTPGASPSVYDTYRSMWTDYTPFL